MIFSACDKEIENLNIEIVDKEKQRLETLKQLDESMAKVKVLEKDKEKKQISYKVSQRKKENLANEDMQIILRGRR